MAKSFQSISPDLTYSRHLGNGSSTLQGKSEHSWAELTAGEEREGVCVCVCWEKRLFWEERSKREEADRIFLDHPWEVALLA